MRRAFSSLKAPADRWRRRPRRQGQCARQLRAALFRNLLVTMLNKFGASAGVRLIMIGVIINGVI